ncbi:NTP transferase domain-containing protein [Dermabacter sp. p3-SID358]|uniref:molybdenum cofactor guanylyltransferase n=1 Tax=Dermabacter sp. p3-SID358 TaxID=2916114 RepID=UPI0021A53ED8|nr:NTP transferase domain-containing protein [Dermabacter sp. p3-SID358]MCT1867709.1 NTP transferase domain-containing protein [Dermabacter sp. p3-SID358]
MNASVINGAAVVLAGGRGSRMGGVDKPALDVGERSMRASALWAARSALGEGAPLVLVGERGPDVREIGAACVREDPPFSGPVAGLARGMVELEHLGNAYDVVLVLGGDMPWLEPRVLSTLVNESVGTPGKVAGAVDASGRRQFLCAAWPHAALSRALAHLGGSDGSLAGASAKSLYRALGELRPEPVQAEWLEVGTLAGASGLAPELVARSLSDIDSPEQLEHARSRR